VDNLDIKKELAEHQTVLLLVQGMDYNNIIIKLAKELSTDSVCYITLNKTYNSLKELFITNNVNMKNVFFIDAITKTIKTPEKSEGIEYVNAPGELTEISLAIAKQIKKKYDYIIFDSLTTMLVYSNQNAVAVFLSSLVNSIKESGTKALFYALKVKSQEDVIQECSMFVDKVIEMKKTNSEE
jgi:KaiC/GvpD/RAD55 family RecA-like ATPase